MTAETGQEQGSEDLLVERRHDGIVIATLNRPEERNALSEQSLFEAIERLCHDLQSCPDARVLVLTGAGTAFSAGGNIKHMRDGQGMFAGSAAEIHDRYRVGIQKIPLALYQLELPVIAAVNGPAFGAGCDLACMCDIRIASTRARFAENFVKLGLISGDGGAWFLPRVAGLSKAAEMAFTGDPVDAESALACGLVSKLVAPDQLMAEALELAGRIAINPGRALRWTKRLMREGSHMPLDSLLRMAAAYQGMCHESDSHKILVDGFFKNRS